MAGEGMGWLRGAVGAVLIAAPGPFLRLSGPAPTGAAVLLLRTIGIRDLVLGWGTVRAARGGTRHQLRGWTEAGLASDSIDVVTSLASLRSIGTTEAVAAAGTALLFAAGDLVALRLLGRPQPEPASEPAGDYPR
jgi:hypothetical protein